MSVIPHVRICAGGCRQRRSLPRSVHLERGQDFGLLICVPPAPPVPNCYFVGQRHFIASRSSTARYEVLTLAGNGVKQLKNNKNKRSREDVGFITMWFLSLDHAKRISTARAGRDYFNSHPGILFNGDDGTFDDDRRKQRRSC